MITYSHLQPAEKNVQLHFRWRPQAYTFIFHITNFNTHSIYSFVHLTKKPLHSSRWEELAWPRQVVEEEAGRSQALERFWRQVTGYSGELDVGWDRKRGVKVTPRSLVRNYEGACFSIWLQGGAIYWYGKQWRETGSEGEVRICLGHDAFQMPGRHPHDDVGWAGGCSALGSKGGWAGDRTWNSPVYRWHWMRLPGGEYKKPGAESWGNLQIKSGGGASEPHPTKEKREENQEVTGQVSQGGARKQHCCWWIGIISVNAERGSFRKS